AAAFLFFRGLPADPPAWLTTIFGIQPALVRGVDMARLPGWLGAFLQDLLHQTVVGAAGLQRSAGGVALAALIVLGWVCLVEVFLDRRTPAEHGIGGGGRGMELAERCAIGAGAWSLLWFFLGVVGLYRTWVAVATLLIGVALGVRALRRDAARVG